MNIKSNTIKYFFILGNNPTLSIAEIYSIFSDQFSMNNAKFSIKKNVFILEIDKKIDSETLIKKMGGTIKIGVIKNEIKIKNYNDILEYIKKIITLDKVKGKFKFGFSYYGNKKFNTKQLGMNLKKYLKENKISCRWVTSREPTLSSVIVEQNKLIQNGIEIILIEDNNKLLIGKTLSVQPFKELSKRDYGRPARDDKSGMLPPKLAQIMINLAQIKNIKATILDPFCGSGTILTEAMLMDYKNLIGSDISKKAIDDTKKNIEWIKNNYKLQIVNCKLINKSAIQLSKFIKTKSVDAIITEPYLGPQRGTFDIKKVIKNLEKLYSDSIKEFKKILSPNGCIVMIWPVFNIKGKTIQITPDINGFEIKNPMPKRNTIIYGRDGQKIWREIVILGSKKK